jgi:hypothetical protein
MKRIKTLLKLKLWHGAMMQCINLKMHGFWDVTFARATILVSIKFIGEVRFGKVVVAIHDVKPKPRYVRQIGGIARR